MALALCLLCLWFLFGFRLVLDLLVMFCFSLGGFKELVSIWL